MSPAVGVDLGPGRLDSPFGAGTSSGNLSMKSTDRLVYRIVPQVTKTLWDIWIETRARSGPACSPELADHDAAESSSYSGGDPNVWECEVRFHPMKADGSGWFDPAVDLVPAQRFNPYYRRRKTSKQIGGEFTYAAMRIPLGITAGATGLAVVSGTPIAMTVAAVNANPAVNYWSPNQLYSEFGREGSMARNEVGLNAKDVFYGQDPRVIMGGSNAAGTEQWYPGNNFNKAPFTKHLPTYLMCYSDGTIHGQPYFSAASGSAPTLAGTEYTTKFKPPIDATFTHIRGIFSAADSFTATIAVNGVDKGTVRLTCGAAALGSSVVDAKLPAAVTAKANDEVTVRFKTNVENAVIRTYANGVFVPMLGIGSGYYASLVGDVERVMPVMPVPWPFPRLIASPLGAPTGMCATPASFSATGGSGSVALAWTANGESYIDHYNIYRNGTLLGTSETNSYSDTTGTPLTEYSYQVSSVALDGRESALTEVKKAASTVPAEITVPVERLAFKTTGNTALGKSPKLTLASSTTAGGHLHGFVAGRASGAILESVTDPKGNVYTIGKQEQDAGANTFAAQFSAHITTKLNAGEELTLNFKAEPGPAMVAWLEETTGIKTTGYDDANAKNVDTGTKTALTVGPTAATAQNVEIAWALWAFGTATPVSLTPGAGWSSPTTNFQATTGAASNRSGGLVYKILAASGAQTATATLNAGAAQNGVLATYKGA